MCEIPGLETHHFRGFSVKDTSSVKVLRGGKLPYGTGYLRVDSAELFYKIIGGIQFIKDGSIPSTGIKEHQQQLKPHSLCATVFRLKSD
jgi:hypothetical protein